MTLVSSPSTLPPLLPMEEMMSRASSVRSNSSGHSFNLRGIQEESDEIEENKVYVAVGKEVKEWSENLDWLLKSIDINLLIVFLHVHQLKQIYKTPLGYMPANGLEQQILKEYRQRDKEEMNECLKKFEDKCARRKFKATTLSIDNDDIEKGLLELMKTHKVTDLVMGAGSEWKFPFFSYSKAKERNPRSRIATTVKERAEPSCRIRFISKGELICTREPHQNAPAANNLSSSSSYSSSGHSMQFRSQSMPPSEAEHIFGPPGLENRSNSVNVASGASFLAGFAHNINHNGLENWYARSSSGSSQQNLSSELKTNEDKFVTQSNELERHKRMYEQAQNELMKAKELLLEKTERERDVAMRDAQELNRQGSCSRQLINCTEFTYSEIKKATRNFDLSNKIGEGGFGPVYKGFLRHTTVAIKILSRDSIQGDAQFYQEIEILSRIRHPHLVTLIGACLEARVLVYEYFPLGSLDNHLTYKNRNSSLTWEVRVRVAHEICSALIFLHSSLVVHGDLKPENVLLDSNFMVKLGDLGICRQVNMTNTTSTPYHLTEQLKGTFPYMDPEYFASFKLTPQCDVYSFGIVLLQLVTGKEAKRLKYDVEEAIERRQIDKMVDQSAGWPPEQAKNMIQIGLRCSDASRRRRPDLVKDVWGWLGSISNVAYP